RPRARAAAGAGRDAGRRRAAGGVQRRCGGSGPPHALDARHAGVSASRPELAALDLGGSIGAWEALGFTVAGGRIAVEGVVLRFDEAGEPGLRAWALRGVPAGADLDGIPCSAPPPPEPPARHPNGVERIDHVVVATPRLERTLAALEEVGLEVRRVREAGPAVRQAFLPAGTGLIEVVG